MSSVMTTNPTVDVVCDVLRKVVALNQSDMDSTLQFLDVPSAERAEVKAKLEGLLRGDSKILTELEESLASDGEEGFPILTASGGKTKYELLKKLYVPYGERLYVSHDIVSESLDIGALVAAVAALCGPKGQSLAAGPAVGLAALKLMDRGNGIVITRIPIGGGPCIPTPQ